jgi:hypothetical protein
MVTTGFMGMMFAMSFCDSIEAFEMAASDHANGAPYSYYTGTWVGDNASDNWFHTPFKHT